MMKFSDFGFKENPFSITPDPRYLYLSRGHEESLAHLIYGTGPNGGFVLLTGEVGTGKTLLVRSLLAQQLSDVEIALVLNPRLSRREFIATICDELGIEVEGPPFALKQMIDTLTKHLLKTYSEGRHTVLVVDEAQNLSPRVLEQVRLLTNLETTRHKLLRIILVGQPELLQMLSRKEMRQVDQRITARYHLSPLEQQETARYITHRLAVAGIREDLFTSAAMRLIHYFSDGVPRIINAICERSLLAIFARGGQRAGAFLVWRAAREVLGRQRRYPLWGWAVLALMLMVVVGAAYWQWPEKIRVSSEREVALAPEVSEPEGALFTSPPSAETTGKTSVKLPEAVSGERVADNLPPAVAGQTTVEPPDSDAADSDAADNEAAIFDLERLFRLPQDEKQVYHSLYKLWGESYQSDSTQSPCAQAPMNKLRCLRGQGDWEQIESLNRPLLLHLVKEKQSRLLMIKLKDEDLLVVNDGNGEALLEAKSLQPFWKGEYVMLWRPQGDVALIGEGSAGEAVTWLRKRLELFDHQPSKPGAKIDSLDASQKGRFILDRFDASLKGRLQAFQRKHDLLDDGVAGQQTMIYLNNLEPMPGTPTLLAITGTREN